jgi:hypothetical protein
MAHFAKIDDNNVVEQVIVVHNNELMVDGVEVEEKGKKFCADLFGGNWIQSSYNNNFRKRHALIGYTYDADRDAFIPPKPFESWLLNEETCNWEAPTPMPVEEGKIFTWDEATLSWVEVELPA